MMKKYFPAVAALLALVLFVVLWIRKSEYQDIAQSEEQRTCSEQGYSAGEWATVKVSRGRSTFRFWCLDAKNERHSVDPPNCNSFWVDDMIILLSDRAIASCWPAKKAHQEAKETPDD